MLNIPSSNTDPSYRYKMPRLVTKQECRGNGIKTSVPNVGDVARSLKVPPEYVMKFFGYELGSITKYEDKDNEGVKATIQGKHDNGHMQTLLDKFIEAFVLCPTCVLPEIELTAKKSGDILGKCKACGFNGMMEAAVAHKLAIYVCKNPPGSEGAAGAEVVGKKKTKEQRQAEKAAKNRQAAAVDKDSNEDNEEEEEDETVEASKKERKEKKEKKEKKDKKEKKEKKDKKEKKEKKDKETNGHLPADDDDDDEKEMMYNDETIIDVITRMKVLKDASVEDFYEEIRLLQIANEMDVKLRFFAGIEALFSDKFTAALVTEKKAHLAKLIKVANPPLKTDDVLWAFEHFLSNHSDHHKAFPMVCKALYDADFVEEGQFIAHFEKKLDNPGFAEAKKLAAPFVQWLQTEESSDEESSD